MRYGKLEAEQIGPWSDSASRAGKSGYSSGGSRQGWKPVRGRAEGRLGVDLGGSAAILCSQLRLEMSSWAALIYTSQRAGADQSKPKPMAMF